MKKVQAKVTNVSKLKTQQGFAAFYNFLEHRNQLLIQI